MRIHIRDNGDVMIDPWPGLEHLATPEELVQYAAEITAARDDLASADKMPLQLKAILRGLVVTINQRFPAGQKITEAELKAAIKAEIK